MTLLWHTGFEGCSSNADVQALVDGVGQSGYTKYSATGGYDNGKCITCVQVNYTPFWVNCSPVKTLVVGFHVRGIGKNNYSTLDYRHLMRMIAGASSLRIFNTETGLKLYSDSTLIASSTTVINTDLHHVEFKVFSDATSGTFSLKLDGAEVTFDNPTNLNTTGNDITSVLWGDCNTANARWDNLFLATDWVGELKHEVCYPTSDHSVAFTPTSGTDNYVMVDDTVQDGDTTTVSASASGTKDLYGYSDLPAGLNVKCATVVTPAKKDDIGTVVLNVLAKQDSTEYEVGSHALTTTYPSGTGTALKKVVPTQPDGTAWGDSSTFNDIYWGFGVD